jgi:hypothetical protein
MKVYRWIKSVADEFWKDWNKNHRGNGMMKITTVKRPNDSVDKQSRKRQKMNVLECETSFSLKVEAPVLESLSRAPRRDSVIVEEVGSKVSTIFVLTV